MSDQAKSGKPDYLTGKPGAPIDAGAKAVESPVLGRPTDYRPEYVERLPGMFAEGQSIVEIAVELGVCRDTIYEWAKVYPDFSDALTRGREISQAWWEKKGRKNLFDTETYDGNTKQSKSRKFNDRLWSKNVSCRFRKDWTDKTEVDLTAGPLEIKVSHETERI